MRRAVGLALAVMLVAAPSALAAQLRPGARPSHSGPLVYSPESYPSSEDPQCRKKRLRFEGETTGVYRYCVFFYRFDSKQETSARRDYGAVWIQSRLAPRNGWCAKEMVTVLGVGSRGKLHGTAPRGVKTKRRVTHKARLVVDAQDAALSNGVLRNSFVLYPGELTSRKTTDSSGRTKLRMRWVGSTKRTIAFAGGAEMSWRAGGRLPRLFPGAGPRLRQRC